MQHWENNQTNNFVADKPSFQEKVTPTKEEIQAQWEDIEQTYFKVLDAGDLLCSDPRRLEDVVCTDILNKIARLKGIVCMDAAEKLLIPLIALFFARLQGSPEGLGLYDKNGKQKQFDMKGVDKITENALFIFKKSKLSKSDFLKMQEVLLTKHNIEKTEFTIPSQVSEYEFFQISCLIHLYTRIFHGLEGRIVYERTRNPNKKKKECIVDCSNIEMLINPHQYKAPTDASEAACTPKMMEVGDIPQEMVLSLKKREELCATHKIKPNSDTPIISCNREYLTYSTDIQYLLESYYNEYYTETTENPIANAVIITILCVIFFVLYCALLMAVKKTFFKIPPRT